MSDEEEFDEFWQVCYSCNELKKIARWSEGTRSCETCP
jgi:hypothetical protein